jgi:hypothetical protein
MNIKTLKGWDKLQARLSFVGIKPAPGTWLAGGALVRAYFGEDQEDGDLDFWFVDFEALDDARCDLERRGGTLVRKTDYAETWDVAGVKVQLCRNTYEAATDVVDDFDFTFCRLVYDGLELFMTEATEHDLKHRLLRVRKIGTQTATRVGKFQARGFVVDFESLCTAIQAPREDEGSSAYQVSE